MQKTNRLPEIIISTYQEFYRKLSYDHSYKMPISDRNLTLIDNFISYLNQRYERKQIGQFFVLDFMEISFAWWYRRKNLKYGMQSIKPAWIIGKKSIKRFEKISEDSSKMVYFSGVMSSEIKHGLRTKINRINFEHDNVIKNIIVSDNLNQREEYEKARFHNQPECLVWCASTTTLYHPKSKFCNSCKFKEECKQLQKKNLPKLYRLRNGREPEESRVTGRFFT